MKSTDARHGTWARVLGTLGIGVTACATCCAPPLVVAIGFLGLSGGAAGALLGWWLPLVGVLMVGAAACLLVLPKRRPQCRPEADTTIGRGPVPQQSAAPDARFWLTP